MSLGNNMPIRKKASLNDCRFFNGHVLRDAKLGSDVPIRIHDFPNPLVIIGSFDFTECCRTEDAREKREQSHLFNRQCLATPIVCRIAGFVPASEVFHFTLQTVLALSNSSFRQPFDAMQCLPCADIIKEPFERRGGNFQQTRFDGTHACKSRRTRRGGMPQLQSGLCS